MDYGHGTGHGIGSFLNVHEGPMGKTSIKLKIFLICKFFVITSNFTKIGIGTRDYPDDPGLQVNMFLSNEPGYYEDGQFGIRIEDIVQIVKANAPKDFDGRGALTFHTVTLCPIHTKLINVNLLTEKERKGLNSYHKRVFETLQPLLNSGDEDDKRALRWLEKETQPI